MASFGEAFSSERIIRELCKARVRLAEQRHEALFYHNIDKSRRSAAEIEPTNWGEITEDIFPSRKLWNKFRPKDRDHTSDVTLNTLLRAVHRLRKQAKKEPWVAGMDRVVSSIRSRVLSASFSFRAPLIVKEVKDQQAQTYRPLSSFSLVDKIIDSLTARYLREKLNSALLESCLAFRPRSDGRHKGLDAILQRLESSENGLFVAECDIMGFFDCVSHDIARTALDELIVDAKNLDPSLVIDRRAIKIFDAYLACYSFLQNVKSEAEPRLQAQVPSASYPWREKELRSFYGKGASLDGIGIPQGGSLSGFIANAVLHRADKRIDSLSPAGDIVYLRYCDDMILIAPDRQACKDAFSAYQDEVRTLRLPIHLPKLVLSYTGNRKRDFWSAKSKAPYRWADASRVRSFPWIQFLGYQIRFDGAVRVRPSSIAKELKKITAEADKMLNLLKPENVLNLRRSRRSIAHRLRLKLISMAVGRRTLATKKSPLPKCWANGFRWLAKKPILTTNLKALDRHRERQLSRVRRRLLELDISQPPRAGDDPPVLKYYGRPFSYGGQFRRKQ